MANLEQLIESDDVEAEADKIYVQLENKGKALGVISKETERYVDINEQMYFLLILDWKEEEIDGEDVHLFKISAAVPNKLSEDTVDNDNYMAGANARREEGQGCNLEGMKVDMVFVIDTSRSMQSYIYSKHDMIVGIANKIKDRGDIKFGVVGFRDDT